MTRASSGAANVVEASPIDGGVRLTASGHYDSVVFDFTPDNAELLAKELQWAAKLARKAGHKSANCASEPPDNVQQRPGAVGSDTPQDGLPND